MGRLKALGAMRVLAIASCVVLAEGCARVTLPDEASSPEHAGLVARTQTLNVDCRLVPVEISPGRTIRVALRRSGPPDAAHTIVLLHGALSHVGLWRFLEGPLADDAQVLAIDLPGCGASDKPDPDELDADAYSPDWLARSVLETLRGAGPPLQLRRITLVTHSLGGPIAVRMFANERIRRQYADILDHVTSLVLFTPLHVIMAQQPAELDAIAHAPEALFTFADATGLLQRIIDEATLQSVCEPRLAFRQDSDRFVEILRRRDTRRPAQAMLRRCVPNDGHRVIMDEARKLAADYRKVDVPCLIAWGQDDRTLPVSMGYMLKDDLPNARLRVITHAMHSIPTERPAIALELIRQFARSGHVGHARIARIDGRSGEIASAP